GGAHAAAARVAHQRRQARRPGKADAHAVLEAEAARARDKIEDRAGVETELAHDLDRKAERLWRRDLVRKRPGELLVADARMALRVASDADAADAAAAQHAVVDDVERAPKRSALGAVAGDYQHCLDAGLAIERCQEAIERFNAREVAHRDVRHGF